jgi:hypothetical protein
MSTRLLHYLTLLLSTPSGLSEILKLLNDRFGTSFEPEDEEFLDTLEQKLDQDAGMAATPARTRV